MGAQASSPLPFYQWSAQEVGISAARYTIETFVTRNRFDKKCHALRTCSHFFACPNSILPFRLIDPQNPQPCIAFFVHNNLSGLSITSCPNLTEVSNLLFRCGNADILHHRILRLFLTLVPGGLPCEHPFIEAAREAEGEGQEHREVQYYCLDCKCRVTDPVKIQREEEKRAHFLQQQHMRHQMRMHMQRERERERAGSGSSGSEQMLTSEETPSPPVGVSIAWLVHWTQEHNCWHMPTWLVRRLFVLPLTSQTHCCYADLPHMQQEGSLMSMAGDENKSKGHCNAATGPAHTFICHKWGDLWGDLVRAVSQHSASSSSNENVDATGNNEDTSTGPDWNLKVYLDVFCRVPYPIHSPSSCSDPLAVMRQCQAFLLISSDPPSQALAQHLSPNQAEKLASPHFWNDSNVTQEQTRSNKE